MTAEFDHAIYGVERLLVRDDTLLNEDVQDALAQHKADLAVGIRGRHHTSSLSGSDRLQNAPIRIGTDPLGQRHPSNEG
jgi:hypothetical protein